MVCKKALHLGNVHKGYPMFFDFWRYLPTYVLYTMYYLSMYYVRFSVTYLPTQKSDILYGCSLNYFSKETKHLECQENCYRGRSKNAIFKVYLNNPPCKIQCHIHNLLLVHRFLVHCTFGQHHTQLFKQSI